MLNLSLKGKTAFVCGSTQGIGKAAAVELADLGASVVLIARNVKALNTTMHELSRPYDQEHFALVADFSQPDKLEKKLASFLDGRPEAHILINNTGGPAPGLIADAKTSEFLDTFNEHLVCNHILAQHLIPHMKSAQYGRIVNIISTSVKQPLKNLGVSNTIRAAVASWAKTLANEVAVHGITVNNVLPGTTATQRLDAIIENRMKRLNITDRATVENEMKAEIPVARFASPQEVAAAIAFLCSPSAAYINGINLPVDGGRTLCL
ncbi:MAG: SDR family oxidoreductase [Cytophagales bacterium]|nr:MAG: SDR family oxidoreductase [Cytophagales bacterium]TAF61337.1 MAG: SDR family oxidoreductase [Cytophagales bacterium]